jgi:DNA end-binding protein Ku
MPRSLWNGTIAFGMVRVPVKLYSATESKAIRFRERHATDGGAIEHRRVCSKEDREVPYSEIVKGFEVSSGRYVVLSRQEIAAADGSAVHMVDIEHFVCREEIDPVYYERAYYLGPGKLGDEPYRLLHAALKRSNRVGIGRFVFHNKTQLVASRALDDVIALHTMRFADELVAAGELDLHTSRRKPGKREVETARMLLDQLSSRFQPHRYRDTYRKAVLHLIERKAHGEAIESPEAEPVTQDDDLFRALQASLNSRGPRARNAGSHSGGSAGSRSEGSAGRASQSSAARKPSSSRATSAR